MGDADEAQDLALETFWRLYSSPPRRTENVGGWLYRVALRLGYNALRATNAGDGMSWKRGKNRWKTAQTTQPTRLTWQNNAAESGRYWQV